MTQKKELQKAKQRLDSLVAKRDEMLSLPPGDALDAIISSPIGMAVVHSMTEEDFHFLVNDIGPEDSVPVLSLASAKQWEYLLDAETWKKDRIDLTSTVKWFDLLLEADPERFIKWVFAQKLEFAEYFFFKNIEVAVREHDEDPSALGEGFTTFDQVYYFRIRPMPGEMLEKNKKDQAREGESQDEDKPDAEIPGNETPDEDDQECEAREEDADDGDVTCAADDDYLSSVFRERRNKFISTFLEKAALLDLNNYIGFLLETAAILPAEVEEEEYRLKSVRLAEKGFLPFQEALGIYAPLKPEDMKVNILKADQDRESEDVKLDIPPHYHSAAMEGENLFTEALETVGMEDVIEKIQAEFAALANQVIAADNATVKSREELNAVVKKVGGFLSLGLAILASDDDSASKISIVRNHSLADIFRVGYGAVTGLKTRAGKWMKQSWTLANEIPLNFWGEQWLGHLGGVLLKKPLFFDNYTTTSGLYKEFASLEDIRETGSALSRIFVFDDLFSLLLEDFEPVPDRFMTYKNVVLTLWARNFLGLETAPNQDIRVPVDEFRRFFSELFTETGEKRAVKDSMKENFMDWVVSNTKLTRDELSSNLGAAFEELFEELEAELSQVETANIDPRFILLFFLK